ncbi:MAG TPA: calcium-binding protein [Solirubrobacterales bacterium]|nr:calcium-binding protein [Solirubrobacterales bacterium]
MPLHAWKIAALVVALIAMALPAGASGAPTCAEGPETVGNTIVGTPCDDAIRAPRGVTVVNGEGGNDTLYGGRGNDRLNGGPGDDRLYGGIGDDQLRGGGDDDLISGGFGADSVLDGQAGDDLVRGDATIDQIQNSGGGVDTLSYATGVTPGFFNRPNSPYFFPDFSDYDDFPATVDGRGAYVNLQTGRGDNGRAPHGGGFDEEVETSSFEVVIGTAFADYIVGTSAAQTIYGGGGPDVLLGEGGADQLFGGDEGDYCEAPGGATNGCEHSGSDRQVDPRAVGTVAVGSMTPAGVAPSALYLTGSSGDDTATATFSDPPAGPPQVAFAVNGAPPTVFALAEPPDAVLLAGLGGDDSLTASGFPETTSIVALGNAGEDDLTSGATEDALVDGDGDDTVNAGSGDDAVPNNEGEDDLHAGSGEDLFISDAVCNGDLLDGGPDRDNANWAQFNQAVTIDMRADAAGLVGPDGEAECPSPDLLTDLQALEDIEGTSAADVMVGNEADNQLLGRPGADTYFALGGNDSILANSGTPFDDPDPTIDCGEGWDLAQIDFPENGPDAAPAACEEIEERAPNSFRPPSTPPDPDPEPPTPPTTDPPLTDPPPPPDVVIDDPPDRTAPRTSLLRRPARVLFSARPLRRVVFAFGANETDAHFSCRLDRGPFRPCRSRRAYRVRPGRHVFRVFAIDAAGNRDRTPAVFRFRVRPAG